MNSFVALLLAMACFAGFILALDARKRKALQEQIDELKKR